MEFNMECLGLGANFISYDFSYDFFFHMIMDDRVSFKNEPV